MARMSGVLDFHNVALYRVLLGVSIGFYKRAINVPKRQGVAIVLCPLETAVQEVASGPQPYSNPKP